MATTPKAYLLRICLCLVTAINIAEAGRRSVLTDLYKQAAEQNRPLILVVDNHSHDERQPHQDHHQGSYKGNKHNSNDELPVHFMYPKSSNSFSKSVNTQEKSSGSKTDLLKYYLSHLLSQNQGPRGLKKSAGRSDDRNELYNLDNHNYYKDVRERRDQDRHGNKNRPLRHYRLRSQYYRQEDRYRNDRDRYDRDRLDRYRSDRDRFRGDRDREDRDRVDRDRVDRDRRDRDREDRDRRDRVREDRDRLDRYRSDRDRVDRDRVDRDRVDRDRVDRDRVDRDRVDRDRVDRDRVDRDRVDRDRVDRDRVDRDRVDRDRVDRDRVDRDRVDRDRVDRDRDNRYRSQKYRYNDRDNRMRDSYNDDRSQQSSPKNKDNYGAKVMNSLLRISNDLNCDAKYECKGTCYQRARVLRVSASDCEDLCDKKFSCEDSVEPQVVKKESNECDGRGSGSESCGEEKNSNISTRGYTDKDEEDDPCARGRCKK